MDAEELKLRTKQFALRCLKLADSLPNSPSGRTIANQLARSGSSVAANYRAACRARSKAEFCAKMGIVEEEVDETALWLEMTVDAKLKPERLVAGLIDEAQQLTRIAVKSIVSARATVRRLSSAVAVSSNPQSAIRNPQ